MNSKDNGEHVPRKIYTTKNGLILCKDCNSNNESITESIAINNIVKNLRIKCAGHKKRNDSNDDVKEGITFTNNNNVNENGCDWIGFVKDFDNHSRKCLYAMVMCEYCDKYRGMRKNVGFHYDTCPEYIIDCPLKCDNKIKRKDIDNHLNNTCSNYLLECKNSDCQLKIKRSEYDDHVNKLCERIIVECSFKKYGCDISGLIKKDVDLHMKTERIMHYLLKINFDNNQIRQDLNTLSNKVNNMKNDINDLTKITPAKPNARIEIASNSLLTLHITNDDTSVNEYKVRYTENNSNYVYTELDQLNAIQKIENNDEKIDWKDIIIKRSTNKTVQTHTITNMNNLHTQYIISLQSKNKFGESALNYLFSSSFPNDNPKDISLKNISLYDRLLQLLKTKLNKSNIKLNKLYSGKKDGFTAQSFHRLCDNKGATVTWIKNNHNYIFGAYTSISFKSDDNSYKDSNSFLFTLYPYTKVYGLLSTDRTLAVYFSSTCLMMYGWKNRKFDLMIGNNNKTFQIKS